MTAFTHGIIGKEPLTGILPIRDAVTNIIGLIATAPDADASVFPQDTAILVTSLSRVLDSAGIEGTLRKALEAIAFMINPIIVVIRVASSTAADVIGQNADGKRTGSQALLTAKSMLGVTPKIIVMPELETPAAVQALIPILQKLRAYAYITPRDVSGVMLAKMEDVTAYRATIAAREIELIWPEFIGDNVILPVKT